MRTFSLPIFSGHSVPDSMEFDGSVCKKIVVLPNESFVISRDKHGNILSRLSDMSWKLYPYETKTRDYSTINFSQKIKDLDNSLHDQHRLLLLLSMHPPQGFTVNLGVNTIAKRHALLNKGTHFAAMHDISLYEIFASKEWFRLFAYTISKSLRDAFISYAKFLYKIDHDILPFSPIKPLKIIMNRTKHLYTQTTVIPQRIYSFILTDLESRIDQFKAHWPSIKCFMLQVFASDTYARSNDKSRDMNNNLSNFENAIYPYGLLDYFGNYNVKSVNQLCRFLSEMQYTCKLLIHAYSGMRDDEGYSLPINPISQEQMDGKNVTWVIGTTTKLEKGKKTTRWIIGDPGVKACKVAAEIANFVYDFSLPNSHQQPDILFPNVGSLPCGKVSNTESQESNIANLVHVRFAKLLRSENTLLQEEDLRNLHLTEIGRDWANEKDLVVGKHWHFTSHQFRRSLAYYAIDSGLVQLTSLKRQLQHLSLLMTIYYAKGFTQYGSFFGDHPDHFRYEYKDSQPTVQALTYFRDVYQSTITLSGGHGTWIEQFIKSQGPIKVADKKEETLARFKRGELFYAPRPAGGCMNPSCNLWIIDPIAACSFKGCSNSIIDPIKMRKAVFIYEQFVNHLSPNSPEKKTAQMIVNQAEEYLAKIALKEIHI